MMKTTESKNATTGIETAETKAAEMKTTGIGTEQTMAETKVPAAAQPVVVTQIAPAKLTLAEVRAKLDGQTGRRFWKNLDELAETPAFHELMAEEFPRQAGAGEWVDAVSRRGFLKVMGASLALAGLAGCTKQPDEPIYPYVKAPEDLILGKANYFASAHPFPTGGVPLLVKADSFRPIKVDGNPDHPYNLGSSDVFTQGSLLDLYDPDRSQRATLRGNAAEWAEFYQDYRQRLMAGKANGGEGIYFLSKSITSPTLQRQWSEAQKAYPKAKLVQYEPALAGTAFAKGFNPQFSLDQADVIVSLDADFLSGAGYPGSHKLIREYAKRRKLADGDKTLNRLYVIESTPSTTGMKAEHRLALRASEVPAFAAALASAVGAGGGSAPQGVRQEAQRRRRQGRGSRAGGAGQGLAASGRVSTGHQHGSLGVYDRPQRILFRPPPRAPRSAARPDGRRGFDRRTGYAECDAVWS